MDVYKREKILNQTNYFIDVGFTNLVIMTQIWLEITEVSKITNTKENLIAFTTNIMMNSILIPNVNRET